MQYAEEPRKIPFLVSAYSAIIQSNAPDSAANNYAGPPPLLFENGTTWYSTSSSVVEYHVLSSLPNITVVSAKRPYFIDYGHPQTGQIRYSVTGNTLSGNWNLAVPLHFSIATSAFNLSTVTWNTKPPTQSLFTMTICVKALNVAKAGAGGDICGEITRMSAGIPVTTWGGVSPSSVYAIVTSFKRPSSSDLSWATSIALKWNQRYFGTDSLVPQYAYQPQAILDTPD